AYSAMPRRPPCPALFPYTTLFRSELYDWGGRLMNQTVLLHLDQAEIGGSLLIGPVVIEGAIGMAYTEVRRGVSIHGQIKNKSPRSEEHTSELQSRENLVCRLLLEK